MIKNLLAGILLIFVCACNKQQEEVAPDQKIESTVSDQIVGTWNTNAIRIEFYDADNKLLKEDIPIGSIAAYYKFDKTFGIFSIANSVPAKVKYTLLTKDNKNYINTIGYNGVIDYEIVLLTGTDMKLKSSYSSLTYKDGFTNQTAHYAFFVEELKKQ